MSTATQLKVEDLQTNLADIILGLKAGREFVIMEDNAPIARLLGPPAPKNRNRKPGSARGKLVILREDDEQLGDFADYMP